MTRIIFVILIKQNSKILISGIPFCRIAFCRITISWIPFSRILFRRITVSKNLFSRIMFLRRMLVKYYYVYVINIIDSNSMQKYLRNINKHDYK